jgi:hypothetical protein
MAACTCTCLVLRKASSTSTFAASVNVLLQLVASCLLDYIWDYDPTNPRRVNKKRGVENVQSSNVITVIPQGDPRFNITKIHKVWTTSACAWKKGLSYILHC